MTDDAIVEALAKALAEDMDGVGAYDEFDPGRIEDAREQYRANARAVLRKLAEIGPSKEMTQAAVRSELRSGVYAYNEDSFRAMLQSLAGEEKG